MLKTIVQNQLSEKVSIVRILSQSCSTCCTCPFEEEAQRVSEWGRKWLEAEMHELAKAKETLYSLFKSHLTFLNLFNVLSVAAHLASFQQVNWHGFGLFSDCSVCKVTLCYIFCILFTMLCCCSNLWFISMSLYSKNNWKSVLHFYYKPWK